MNGHANGHASDSVESNNKYDVIVIGAGISGINAGYRLQERLPNHRYTILEGREELGGTWSLFRYPGIRSDSDLYTFGYPFNLWDKPNSIATGDSILEYLNQTAEKFGIDKHIQYRHRVVSADWSSENQHWRLEVDAFNGDSVVRKILYGKFIISGTGYYNYDKPLDAKIPGLQDFKGTVAAPQFWPSDLEYKDKKMVIIGSGATAITILPAVVDGGVGDVTMLQRSPSFIFSLPQKEPHQKDWYDWLPRNLGLRAARFQFMLLAFASFYLCRLFPARARKFLVGHARSSLPEHIATDPHFEPKYAPWDQRLCLCPSSDFYKAFRSERAHVVTDTIKRVVSDGIELSSGTKLPADIIVTATGLNLQLGGGMVLSVDKVPVDIPSRFLWHTTMLTSVPNFALIVGYVNAAWTLGSDSTLRMLTRLMKTMEKEGHTSATPVITDEEMRDSVSPLALKSTYVELSKEKLPKAGKTGPWKNRKNYLIDNWKAEWGDVKKGLVFEGRRC